jgi:hypothetical protein
VIFDAALRAASKITPKTAASAALMAASGVTLNSYRESSI